MIFSTHLRYTVPTKFQGVSWEALLYDSPPLFYLARS